MSSLQSIVSVDKAYIKHPQISKLIYYRVKYIRRDHFLNEDVILLRQIHPIFP